MTMSMMQRERWRCMPLTGRSMVADKSLRPHLDVLMKLKDLQGCHLSLQLLNLLLHMLQPSKLLLWPLHMTCCSCQAVSGVRC